MTVASASHLSRARIHRLLQAVGSTPGSAEPDIEAVAYDWREPHYFNDDQHNRLAAVMTQVAALLSERFVHFYKSEFNVKVASITQHFAGELASQIDSDQGYSLPFGPGPEQSCGFLIVASETALDWATRLLGDSETNDDPNRAISSLEESLLADLLTAVVDTFLSPLRTSQILQVAGTLCKGSPPVPYDVTEEICRVVFEIRQGDAQQAGALSFVLPCQLLAPMVGKTLALEAKIPSQEQLTHLLMEHIQQMPITVTARLAATRLNFEEVLDLGPDDVLLIDKPLEDPVDVIVDGQTVLRGRPAQSNNQYAIFVTEWATEPARRTATASTGN